MSDAMGPEVLALLRGELAPTEEGPVRAHLAACADCAALAAAYPAIRAAAAARPSPAPDMAALARVLDGALAEADAADRARGPVLRLLDRASHRYVESRSVRFFTYSLAVHAAAAVILAVHLAVGTGNPEAPGERILEVSTVPLPPPYPDDPLGPVAGPMPGGGMQVRVPVEVPWPHLEPTTGPRLPAPREDPPFLGSSIRLYPGTEFAAFASPRFRRDQREKRFLDAYGPVDGPRAALTVNRGLGYLYAAQDPDGTWASGRPGDPKALLDRFRGGVTGIALLAFLGDGRTAMRDGPYRSTVRAGVEALVRSADPATGLLGRFARGAADDRPLCNHGPALAALAEAYGIDFGLLPEKTRTELAAVVDRALAATSKAQLPDGSFGYAAGAERGDSSVTLLQVEGIEAARRAGFAVDPEVLRRAGAWIAARIGPDGRLGYRVAGDRSKDGTLTAEALPLARALGLGEDVRARMRAVVVAEADPATLGNRILFRTAAVEALVAPPGAVAALSDQGPGGAIPSAADPYARAAGDALSTARTVRALTAPYRASW